MTALERFKSWVREHDDRGLTRREIAAISGLGEATLSRIVNGTRYASGEIAAKIEAATATWDQGPILAASWYPRPKTKRAERARLARRSSSRKSTTKAAA